MAGTKLLNDDGNASMATALMMSHHAFRRDIAQFAAALQRLSPEQRESTAALREEWQNYRNALHGHHESEDTRMFPFIKGDHPELAQTIDRLSADHRRIDPLLERGDRAFGELPNVEPAKAVVAELIALLDDHLSVEEAEVVPHLRGANSFPPPQNEAEAEMYAQGFAWSSHGIAPNVLERVNAMLPAILSTKLPAARKAYETRCTRAFGSAKSGASQTSVPDWLEKTSSN